jgi:hypothetical protein
MIIPEFHVTPVVRGKDAIRVLKEMENPTPMSESQRIALEEGRKMLARRKAREEAAARPSDK